MLRKRKDIFIEEASSPGEKVDSCPETDSPLSIREQEISKGSFRVHRLRSGYKQNSTVSSSNHLEIDHVII